MGVKITFPLLGDGVAFNPPTYFTIFGRAIYWYAVIVTLGFVLAALYVYYRRADFGLTQDNILDLFIVVLPSALIGARLYYVIFNPGEFFGPGKWLNIFHLREGGLAVYGGIILSAITVFIYARKKKIPLGVVFDVCALGLVIGQCIGRWGNFINREAYGTETLVPWRMGLTYGNTTIYVHPTFLYESLWNAIGFVFLHFFSKKSRKYNGQIALMYIAWYGLGRFFIEGLRTDSLFIGNTGIRASQLVAIVSCIAAVALLVRNHIVKKESPALTAAGPADPSDAQDSDDIREANAASEAEDTQYTEDTQHTEETMRAEQNLEEPASPQDSLLQAPQNGHHQ
ncbi:MAG TPA: prolipoprotein diacylglyceryl transferase [Papillibacter sp.]|jgi:phosphatidylglycerol:prolipoprotein diacylglycerol transferase|nr:prolipoprotein diacylglyceryl transferase [Papillibacter sp.]